MFVPNTGHLEDFLSIWSEYLSPEKLEQLKNSKGYKFYELIFCNIKEEYFACLYSKNKLSAPNSPVNQLVAALILCHQRNWSHQELERQILFNVEIRVALGLKDLEVVPFSMKTFYNFKNRLSTHQNQTGENLLEKVFNNLTKKQIADLKLNTSIQRGDSVLLDSSIRSYSRLSLLVEVLRRLYLILSEEEKKAYHLLFQPYIKGGEKFMYTLQSNEGVSQMHALTTIYYTLYEALKEKYSEHTVFQIFEQVYQEHFKFTLQEATTEEEEQRIIQLRPNEELGSKTLQSPDDLDATYRSKQKEGHHGFVAFGAETCHPDNEINLVTTLSADVNNIDDSVLLENQLDHLAQQSPDLKEFHQDGAFGSKAVDEKAKEHGIALIQTAIRGKTAKVPIQIDGDKKKGFIISCPNSEHPKVEAQLVLKNYKAVFDLSICNQCPFKNECVVFKEQNIKKQIAVYRFTEAAGLMQKRHRAIQTIPKERRNLRAGVEGLMAHFHRCARHTGKLRTRGLFNCQLYVYSLGIAINFERIFQYLRCFLNVFTFFSILSLQERLYRNFIPKINN